MQQGPILFILAGLPGVGKSTIARELARQLDAVHVRLDSIEQALLDSGTVIGPMDDHGYRVAYDVARENLRSGRSVVADSVNPVQATRDAWRETARHCGAVAIEVEVVCSDETEHRRRAENRSGDIPGLRLPTWHEVLTREYEPWDRKHTILDTAVSGG